MGSASRSESSADGGPRDFGGENSSGLDEGEAGHLEVIKPILKLVSRPSED